MAALLEIALSNLIVATLLAFVAALAGVWGRRPALTHALWLLVFLKLITPPLFRVPIDWPTPVSIAAEKPQEEMPQAARLDEVVPEPAPNVAPPLPEVDDWIPDVEPDNVAPQEFVAPGPALAPIEPAHPVPLPALAPPAVKPEVTESWHWADIMASAGLVGSAAWIGVALVRLRRFQRLLRVATPASAEINAVARQLAEQLGIRCPELLLLPGRLSPMLWTFGTARLLLPAELVARLPAAQLTSLIAHELAHWRRRDDRVRWLELAVLTLYWWCPLVWWARRALRQAEEECCDAWVVSLCPEATKDYALALVETVDFLSGVPAPLPLAASGVGHVRLLKRRLTMILQSKTPRALSRAGYLGVAGVALLILPMVPGWAQDRPGDSGGKPDAKRVQPNDPKDPVRKAHLEEIEATRGEVLEMKARLAQNQAELQARQNELARHAEQLQKAVQRLQQLENAANPPGGKGNYAPGTGAPPFPPGPAGSIDKRLSDMERKLEQMLQDIRALRNEMRGGPKKGPGFTPNPPPNPVPVPKTGTRPPMPPPPPVPAVLPRNPVLPNPPPAPNTPALPADPSRP